MSFFFHKLKKLFVTIEGINSLYFFFFLIFQHFSSWLEFWSYIENKKTSTFYYIRFSSYSWYINLDSHIYIYINMLINDYSLRWSCVHQAYQVICFDIEYCSKRFCFFSLFLFFICIIDSRFVFHSIDKQKIKKILTFVIKWSVKYAVWRCRFCLLGERERERE